MQNLTSKNVIGFRKRGSIINWDAKIVRHSEILKSCHISTSEILSNIWILRVLRVKPSAKTLERHYYTVTAAAAMPKRFRARRGRGRRGRGRSSNHHMRERSSIGQQ